MAVTEQPRDISTVLQTLYTLYGNATKDFESHSIASKWLTELQNSIEGWDVAHQLLNLNNDTEYVNYFAANTMHSKVRDSFAELPKDAHMALRDSLLHHLTLRASKPSAVTMQLVLALADLALQMDGWDSVIEDVIVRFSSDAANVPTLLDLLVVLPEEINHRALRLGNNRRQKLTEIMSKSCRNVLELLVLSLNHWPNDIEIKTRVFNCLSSWISLRSFPVEEVAASPLVTAPFSALHDVQSPDKLYEAAADCICAALYVCYDVNNFEPLALVLKQQVDQLLPLFLAVIETENSLRANCLARIFTEMAESYLFNIIHYPDTPVGNMNTLDLLLVVAKHYEYEIFDMTFPVWYRLAEMLSKLKDAPTSNRFIGHIDELINGLMKHCQLSDDLNDSEIPDEKGDFADFRQNVVEVMRDLVFIVGSIDVFQKLYNVICTGTQSWYVTESCLFLMCSIASTIKRDESVVLPIALPVLLSIPPNIHYAVRGTTLRLIGELSHWISKHPDILNDVLRFLQDGLSIRPLASISAVGIQNLCQKCKGQMAHLFDSLLDIIRAADSLGISNNSVVGLMTGIVDILLSLPNEKIAAGIHGLCLMSIQKLIEIAQIRPDVHPHSPSDPALWTDRLSAVFRECIYKPEPGETHPALESAKEVLPPLYAILEIYKSDPRIVERGCRCLRFMLRCLRSHANTIIDQIITVSITLYKECYHSCYLYLGSIIVDEFGPDSVNHAGLLAMTESFVTVSFTLLSGTTGLIDHPDTIDDMFRLCARMIQRCPLVFLKSPITFTAVQCGLAASQHMHRDAFSSVMKFFRDLAHVPFDDYFPEPDHSEITMITSQILGEYGQSLMNSLIKGFISLPYDMLTESSVVFWELLHNYSEYAIKWVETGLADLDPSKITEEQKLKFLHTFQETAAEDSSHSLELNVKELARIFR